MIEQIASPEYNSPPLVVFGPFGTGKTFTLNQAVRLLVQLDKSHRILLCTHSNRAADIHVEHLHKYLNERNGVPAARPLRVYQPMRRYICIIYIARMASPFYRIPKTSVSRVGNFFLFRPDQCCSQKCARSTELAFPTLNEGACRGNFPTEIVHGCRCQM